MHSDVIQLVSHRHHSGLQQSGLAATIAASIALLPDDLQGMFWANIGLTGGTTKFPGFYERLYVNRLGITDNIYVKFVV